MDSAIVVALLSLLGTLVGTFGGIVTANKLVTYRLEKLEEKVNKHNNVIERTFVLEGQMAEIQHDITDLKAYHRPN